MTNKPIRHGEILLFPVSKLPSSKKSKHISYIVGHSETGYHHVLESNQLFEVVNKDDLYIRLFEPALLVHKKTVDRHKDLEVVPGVYKVIYKNEYDPFAKVIQRVQD